MSILRTIASGRMLVSLIMGFASGLPLLLTITVLQAWMKEEGVDLTTIGLFALVGLPYSLKFLWSPLFDRFIPPFLGRRRGWLLITQILLMIAIAGLGLTSPRESLVTVAVAAFLVTFFSASQDILIDAYRRETLADEELGLGSSLYVNGYRLGMLLASGGGLIMADHMPYQTVYLIMAACLVPGIFTTLLSPEPSVVGERPRRLMVAVVRPFVDYFRRPGAVTILAFVVLYKVGDTMASAMTTPFYLDIGFTKTEIGTVVKLFGTWAVLGGGMLGGVLMLRLGINRALWIFGVLQAVSTVGFAVLARIGHNIPALAAVIGFENVSGGMGTAAFMAFMASVTNRQFTATQYALLTSVMAFSRTWVSAPTGLLAERLGWEAFFVLCALVAAPGMALLLRVAPWRGSAATGAAQVESAAESA